MRAILIALISLNFLFFSCEKEGSGPVIKGKLVYTSCATMVVQVLDSSAVSLAQESWQQSAGMPVYKNVFAVANKCSFGKNSLAVGDEFYFRVATANDKDCVVCALWDNPPGVSQQIEFVSK